MKITYNNIIQGGKKKIIYLKRKGQLRPLAKLGPGKMRVVVPCNFIRPTGLITTVTIFGTLSIL